MFDPKRYDTRMRDPDGRRRKPAAPEPRMPKEARIRKRAEERAEAPVDEHITHRGPEVAFGKRRPEETRHAPARRDALAEMPLGWLALGTWLLIAAWRFLAGAPAQGWIVLALGGLGLLLMVLSRTRRAAGEGMSGRKVVGRSLLLTRKARKTGPAPPPAAAGRTPSRPRPPAPRPTRKRRAKKSIGGFLTVLTLTSVAGAGIKNCTRSENRRPPREIQHRRVVYTPPRPTPRPLRRTPPRVDLPVAHFPPTAPDRISGRVRFAASTTLAGVEVVRELGRGKVEGVLTDEHGVFVFDGLPTGTHELYVRGCVDLTGGRGPRSRVPTDTRVELSVDPARALILERAHTHTTTNAAADVQVAPYDAKEPATGTWKLDRDRALVTGLEPGGLYDVLVRLPYLGKTALATHVRPGQRVPIALEAGTEVSGRLRVPPGVDPPDVRVTLAHGGVRVEADVEADGTFRAKLLPRGSRWTVTAAWSGRRRVSRAVQAGAGNEVVLDLR